MIGRCQNGPSRRQMLADIDRPMRPAVRRFRRRALIGAKLAACLVAVSMLVVIMLLLLADAAQHDPVTVKKPVSAPAAKPLRRMT